MALYEWKDGELVTAEKLNAYGTGMEELKTEATNAASAARDSEASATASAELAAQNAQRAETAEASAEDHASAASESAASAQESAASAENTVSTVTQKAAEAESSAILSQSYAKGGTGTRTGEDTDNAKYYMEQAKQAAGGDVDLTGYATTAYVDEKDTSLQNQINNKANASYVNQALVNVSDSISTLETNLSTKVDKTTKVNGKALSQDITLTAQDVGAADAPTVLETTLIAGDTILQIDDSSITEDSMIDIYTDTWGVNPGAVIAGDGLVALFFDANDTDVNIRVEVKTWHTLSV